MFTIKDIDGSVLMTLLHPIKVDMYIRRVEKFTREIAKIISAEDKTSEISNIDIFLEREINDRRLANYPSYLCNIHNGESVILENTWSDNGFTLYKLNSSDKKITLETYNKNFVDNIVKNINDYTRIYPNSKDGMTIYFVNTNNVGLIKDVLGRLAEVMPNDFKYNIVLHVDADSRKASIVYEEISKFIDGKEEFEKSGISYLPNRQLNVINYNIQDLLKSLKGKRLDVAILVDYFNGHHQSKFVTKEYVNTNNIENEKIHKETIKLGNMFRNLDLNNNKQIDMMRSYYNLQYAIHEVSNNIQDNEIAVLQRNVNLTNEASNMSVIHDVFNWVVCYDENLDKFLMNNIVKQSDVIIEYIHGINRDDNRNLIISSSKKNMNSLKNKIHRKLETLLSKQIGYREETINYIIDEVVSISGDLVLKSIGLGSYLNELMGIFFTKILVNDSAPAHFALWIYIDDFEGKWYNTRSKRPDLLYLTLDKINGKLSLKFNIIECKFIEGKAFEKEKESAIVQVTEGVNIIKGLFGNDNAGLKHSISDLTNYIIENNYNLTDEQKNLIELLSNVKNKKDFDLTIENSIFIYTYDQAFEDSTLDIKTEKRSVKGNSIDIHQIDSRNILKLLKKLADSTQNSTISNTIEDYKLENYDIPKIPNMTDEIKTEINSNKREGNPLSVVEAANDIIDEPKVTIEEKEDKTPAVNVTQDETGNQTKIDTANTISSNPEQVVVENSTYNFVRPEIMKVLKVSDEDEVSDEERKDIEVNLIRLKKELNLRNIAIDIKDYKVGPDIIEVHFTLGPGIDISSITKNSQNMMLWLKVNTEPYIFIRNGVVNLQIERSIRKTVNLKNVLTSFDGMTKYDNYKKNFYGIVGVDILGTPYVINFADSNSPHLLVAGQTGSGKSVTLRSLLVSIMALYNPDDVELILIDPKQVELSAFGASKYVTRKTATDAEGAVNILNDMITEMERRYKLFSENFATDISRYNSRNPQGKLKRILVVFDEYADFMMTEFKDELEACMIRLSAKARAAGIHLVICTQTPKAEVITTTIRNNLPARIALRVPDKVASNLILGQADAEKLLGKGDMLFVSGETPSAVRIKAPYTNEDELYDVIDV
jgi:S-DNA-T family DNA segregation ATPase FtsK/SpoIIIE